MKIYVLLAMIVSLSACFAFGQNSHVEVIGGGNQITDVNGNSSLVGVDASRFFPEAASGRTIDIRPN